MIPELQQALAQVRDIEGRAMEYGAPALHEGDVIELGTALDALAKQLDALANETTNVQALALARLMRDRPNSAVMIDRHSFDLPEGYWLVGFTDPDFGCGIAPDGSVSS